MTDLPKTREYEHYRIEDFAPQNTMDTGYYNCQVKADAMRDELLTRIAELEAHTEHDEDNLEGLEGALFRANQRYTKAETALAERDISLKIVQAQKEKHKQARAELADDLDWLIDTLDFNLQESGLAQKALDKRHADLRARANASREPLPGEVDAYMKAEHDKARAEEGSEK